MRFRTKLVIGLVVLTAILLLVWRPVRQNWNFATLQEQVAGWVVGRNANAPKWVEPVAAQAQVLAFRVLGKGDLRAYRVQWQVGMLLGGQFDAVRIEASQIPGDPGAVLKQFPELKILSFEFRETVGETEVMQVCRRLREIPQLTHLELWGRAVTDASIAPLAGHPGIKGIYFQPFGLYTEVGLSGTTQESDVPRITKTSIATFGSMPSLNELALPVPTMGMPHDDLKPLTDALPSVRVGTR
jgi:hypothetical protein